MENTELDEQVGKIVEAEEIVSEEIDGTIDDGEIVDSENSGDENTSEEGQEEKKEEVDPVQKRINKIHREKKEAEEAAASERLKREELEAKLSELQKVEIPDIPPVPDYLDADFDEKMAERDKVIALHAQEQSKSEALAKFKEDNAKEEALKHTQRIKGMVDAFDERAAQLQLDKSTLLESQNVVGSYIKGKAELAQFLLSDEQGPLNVVYLSQNHSELEKISQMSETAAAVYIATKIAPEAERLKPKTTNAPAPPYNPQGNKNVKELHPFEVGATYE